MLEDRPEISAEVPSGRNDWITPELSTNPYQHRFFENLPAFPTGLRERLADVTEQSVPQVEGIEPGMEALTSFNTQLNALSTSQIDQVVELVALFAAEQNKVMQAQALLLLEVTRQRDALTFENTRLNDDLAALVSRLQTSPDPKQRRWFRR